MEIVIIIAKSAAILTLFYVLYVTILRKDTFFTANRHYLLAGIIAALVIPFIEFTKTVYLDIPLVTAPINTDDFNPISLEAIPQETPFEINWWAVALVLYSIGAIILLGRLVVQLYSLKKLLNKFPSKKIGNFTFVKIKDTIAPFSFFRHICYNPDLHTQEELQMIIAHEKVHARQLHTIDVLLTQVVLALQWINPLAWFYKKSLEQNLEFLADSGALRAVDSSRAYQYALVKVSSTALRPALTNQFYHSLIKKRIIMLNKETSRKRNLLKLGIVLPLLGLFMYSFNVKEVITYRDTSLVEEDTAFAKANSKEIYTEFTIDAATTDAYLKSIEAYFKNTFESTAVRFTKVNHIQGKLVSFVFQTKMNDESRFFARFSVQTENGPLPAFTLTPVKEHEVLQTYQDGYQVQFTPEGSKTTITPSKNETSAIGENPALVVNGSVINTDSNKIKYETEDGITIVNPKDAIALYGEAASDGAIVIDDPNYTTKINGKYIQQPAFVINHTTTDSQINALEQYFKEHHPDALIDIHKVQRDSKGEITSYHIKTRFENTSEWQNILEINNKSAVFQGIQVRYLKDSGIQLKELGPKGIEMRSTPKGLFVANDELAKGLTAFSEGMQELSKSLSKDISLPINKNTTDVQLDKYKERLMKEHGLDLSYSLRRNEAREITSIQISYTGALKNGSHSITGDNPIDEFFFFLDELGNMGFWSEQAEARALQNEERVKTSRSQMKEVREERKQALEERGATLEEVRKELKRALNGRKEGLQNNDTYSFVITKSTTREELDALASILKTKYNASLDYSKLHFNKQGEITGISIKFEDSNGNSQNISVKSGNPINNITIFRTADGRSGVTQGDSADVQSQLKEMEARRSQLQGAREERKQAYQERRATLEKAREERLKEIKAKQKEKKAEMEVQREAMKARQKKLRQENDKGYVTLDDTTYYFANSNGQTKFYDRFGEEIANTDPLYDKLFKQKGKKSKKKVNKDKRVDLNNFSENALYIVDGVEYTQRPINIDPDTIKDISVLKGLTAASSYGQKGKNGVIVIKTKE